jgi:hypothetical protein
MFKQLVVEHIITLSLNTQMTNLVRYIKIKQLIIGHTMLDEHKCQVH